MCPDLLVRRLCEYIDSETDQLNQNIFQFYLHKMNRTLIDYYRCPEAFVRCLPLGESSPEVGYFRFGPKVIGYGSIAKGNVSRSPSLELHDVSTDVVAEQDALHLSFNPTQAVENLLFERYCDGSEKRLHREDLAAWLYYRARPYLGIAVRRYLQRFRLRGWRSIAFPRWPVDRTVEQVHETLLRLCLQASGGAEIPFIWFWPKGFSSCISVTHDVETVKGRDFCRTLMELDERFDIKSSVQLIPEDRYSISMSFLEGIKSRGFELNVHDLNHDGRLFANESQFRDRARRINQYGRAFGAQGFRSGVLYRNLAWCGALEFSYDMSVPNTAHLDPQRGGCCTVMPFFAGRLVEIPLTTTQDYSLFHILGDYSISLWRQQLDIIGRSHGIASFNIHPDYVIEPRARSVYVQLLQHISKLRSEKMIWIALPGEVDSWWRTRAKMQIVRRSLRWVIEGVESERAQLAFARLRGGDLEYSWTSLSDPTGAGTALSLPSEGYPSGRTSPLRPSEKHRISSL